MKIVYWILCVLGTLLPLAQFLPWLAEHGLNIPLMVQQIAISPLSAFAWLDVLVFAIVLIVFICIKSQRLNMRSNCIFHPVGQKYQNSNQAVWIPFSVIPFSAK